MATLNFLIIVRDEMGRSVKESVLELSDDQILDVAYFPDIVQRSFNTIKAREAIGEFRRRKSDW